MLQPLWNTVWQFLKRINTELSYDLAVLPQGTQVKENLIKTFYLNVYRNVIHNNQNIETSNAYQLISRKWKILFKKKKK